MSYDVSTMPSEMSFNWDPNSIVGRALTVEVWRNISPEEKYQWLDELNSPLNENAWVTKLIDFECFMTVIIRGSQVSAKFIVLDEFQRFMRGPIILGPHVWPRLQ